jgi:UDP-N-acetylmuramoyl-tripeptide--D-alanyl-D-alanine ligase
VTGSNGKTTTKEMIASILKAAYGEAVLATQGNFNNDIGLPLTLLRLNATASRGDHRDGHESSGRDRLPGGHRPPDGGAGDQRAARASRRHGLAGSDCPRKGQHLRGLDENGVAVFNAR